MTDTLGGFPKPPHGHVPGQNARHPEDWFDRIKTSVHVDMQAEDLQDTAAFRAGLIYLETGFFWECHEVLEAVWLQTPQDSPERDMTQALIQLANARLKILMMRPNAAVRLCDKVEAHLARYPARQSILGVSPQKVLDWTSVTRRMAA